MKQFINLFFRVIWKNRLFSVLNIAGLAVGIASFIIIVLWIVDELSYDKYNSNYDRIARVVSYCKIDQSEDHAPYCPAPLALAAQRDFPEVESYVRFCNYGSFIIEYGENVYDEPDIIFADSTFFNVFSVELLNGDPSEVLKSRRSITLSESAARKYFGDEDPVGKMLRLNNRTNMEVTGVYRDMPPASHFHFDFIASVHTYSDINSDMWLSNNFITYLLLKENTDIVAFEEKMSGLVDKYISEQASQALGMSWEEILESGTELSYSLQPLSDIHLYSKLEGEFEPPGSINAVRIFAVIAIFIILLACINFTNLSSARASTRLKEVGVRKTFGVPRVKLIRQFILESLIIVFIAHLLSMVMVELSLPYFNNLTGKALSVSYFSLEYVLSVASLIIVISLMAGAYPSFYLSSFKPISILRGVFNNQNARISFRSILVIIQFFISLVLLSSTLILSKQMRYLQSKELGFDKEQVMVINNTHLIRNELGPFKQELLKIPGVAKVSVSGFLPVPSNRVGSSVFPDAVVTEDLFSTQLWRVDIDYADTYGLKIIEGRNFSVDYPGDSLGLLINETAKKDLGWDEPVGRIIGVPNDYNGRTEMTFDEYTIIGVVEDFHYESLHLPIEPLMLHLGRSTSRTSVGMQANIDINALLQDIEVLWKEFAPGKPFSYSFVDQKLQEHYSSEQKLGTILLVFTIFAFFVSSLGLVGLSIFTSEQRKKEIGLRKVNGSKSRQIVWLLSFDFTRLVAVSFILSVPVTIIFMQNWLATFAYRAGIRWWIFLLTLAFTYGVALISIIFQSYRAATANPVDTFRTE